ncbi:MAG: methylcobamide--CoM methyltransferase [Lachnospiraceae bacterium]|nr:methylcobamide--CoM methyltransferase [Lachnospiraceae bacterium]
MNSLERIRATIKKEEHDRPICICPGGMMNYITTELLEKGGFNFRDAHVDAKTMADLSEYAWKEGCFENMGVPFCMTVELEGMGSKIDLGDNKREPRVVEYIYKKIEETTDVKRIDLSEGRVFAVLKAISILKERHSDVPVVGNLTGPVSIATSLIDSTPFYVALRKKGDICHEFLRKITDELIKFGSAMADSGADVIMIADPSATGEILGPKYFKEFAVKYLNDLVEGIKKNHPDVIVIVHICGQMTPVLAEANEINSDAFSFDAIVGLKDIRKNMQDKIIMGNVSTYAIEGQDEEKVKQMTKLCITQGMDIISPACGLGMGSPLKNVQAVLTGTKEYGGESCLK